MAKGNLLVARPRVGYNPNSEKQMRADWHARTLIAEKHDAQVGSFELFRHLRLTPAYPYWV
jgi:hypothetical protein